MINSEHHFLINGVPYQAAESAEGKHYIYDTPTLRAPNAQVVQGGDAGEVNLDPDTLLWKLTDWSEGEGQLKYDRQAPGRSEILEGVNWFGRPGNLFLGYEPNITLNSAAGTFTTEVGLVVARDQLYAVGIGLNNDDFYAWDGPNDWAAGVSFGTVHGARSPLALAGDGNYLFLVRHSTDEVWRWTGSSWANHNNQTGGNVDAQLLAKGDYLYKYDQDGKVYELSKVTANTSTPETPILDFSSEGTVRRFNQRHIVAGDNRVYVAATYKYESVIYEIVPTSPATTGYGREMLRLKGQSIESIWFHGGFLFWTGLDNEADGAVGVRRVIYYLQPGASYGTLGELRSFDRGQAVDGGITMMGASRQNTFAMLQRGTLTGTTPDDAEIDLWEVDAVSGGYGIVGKGATLSLGAGYSATSTEYFEGKVFASIEDRAAGTTFRTIFWDTTEYNTSGEAISPSYDFSIAAEKVLQSIEVQCEALPANTSYTISYSLDGGSWTALTTQNTDGQTGNLEVVSTDTAVKTFRELRIKVALVGTSSATPFIKSVNVRASVNETKGVWQLLLDCSDEHAPRGWSGAKLQATILALQNTVVAFRDGYRDRNPNAYTEYDVIVERVTIDNDRPGEGVAQVILREVT